MTVREGNSVVKIYHFRRVVPAKPERERSEYDEFKVAFYFQGKRKMETYSSFAVAKRRADEINDSVNDGNAETLTLTAIERLEYTQAKEILLPLGVSLSAAVMTFAEVQKILGPTPQIKAAQYYVQKNPANLNHVSALQACEEYLKTKTGCGLSAQYVYDLGLFFKGWQEGSHRHKSERSFCSAFKCPLSSITESDLAKFLDSQKVGPYALRQRRNWLTTFFAFCKKKKYLPQDWFELDEVPAPKIPDSEIEIYTPSEVAHLLSSLPEEIRIVMAISAFSGMRLAEVLRLDWAQVGIGGGKYIEVKGKVSKTRQRRLIPMTENLKAWIGPSMKPAGKLWTLIPKSFTTARIRAIRKIKDFKLKKNALRHSYISYRMAQTSDAALVSLEAGNSPRMVFQHYRQLVSAEDAAKWFEVMPAPGDAGDKITWLKTAAA